LNWLVTGGCGFIGRALIRTLMSEGENRVRVYDNLSVGKRQELAQLGPVSDLPPGGLPDGWENDLGLVVADIEDGASLAGAAAGADVLVHLAANTGVAQSVQDPRRDCRTNVLGVLNALEAGRHGGVARFVFASSGAPLGIQVPPLHEEMAPHPVSPYGASKLAGEGYCSAYHHCFGVETVVLRFGNVYGEGSTHKSSVVARFIKRAMAGEALEIYGDGSQTRDFIHVEDLVRAVVLAATARGVGGEVFQIATASETTVAELTRRLIVAMRSEGMTVPPVTSAAPRQGDVARNYSDTSKARERLGWRAEISLDEGLRRTVRFFMQSAAGAEAQR
jgi:UDP-glucose 4-epimerase